MRSISRSKSLAALGAASVATVLLAACGSSGGSSSAAGAGPASNGTQSIAQLLPAANKEGQVVWYTTFVSSEITPIIQAFNKQYPQIKAQSLRLSADQIPPRVLTEQKGGSYDADVITGDAVQLASCLYLQREMSQPLPFVAFDARLAEAARHEGLTVVPASKGQR